MEDENGSQNEIDKRGKKPRLDYFKWSEDMADELLRLLVIEVKNGNRLNNGNFRRSIVEENVIPILKEKFGKDFTYDSIRNKIRVWKRSIADAETLIKNNSGFGWDATTQRFTCAEDTWQDYIKAHPGTPSLKDKIFLRFDEYRMVAGNHGASGKNAGGLGSEGVEDARSANVRSGMGDDSLDESVAVDDYVGSEVPNDMPSPTDTTAPPYMPETIPCTSNSGRRRRIPNGVEAQSMVDKLANEFSDANANLAKLVAVVDKMESRSSDWVNAVNSTTGFQSFQKWNVINDPGIGSDLKNAFVKMNDMERREFMTWRLTGRLPQEDNEDEETQDDGDHNPYG